MIYHLREEPGWFGAFVRSEAEGALRNGTPIVKASSEPNDMQPDGTPGIVLGSITAEGQMLYFIEWAPTPKTAVAVMAWKLREANRL